MPDFNIIANVSQTLVSVLRESLQAVDPLAQGAAPVPVLHDWIEPPVATGPPRLLVFLFEVCEDPSARNRRRVRQTNPANQQQSLISKPPMALLLRYLLTPFAPGANNEAARLLEHRILGRVAQTFYDGAIIAGTDLVGQGDQPDGSGLEGSSEALKLTLAPLTLEDRTRIWAAVQQDYRLSLTYEVRVVNLEPTPGDPVPVVSSRELEAGILERQP